MGQTKEISNLHAVSRDPNLVICCQLAAATFAVGKLWENSIQEVADFLGIREFSNLPPSHSRQRSGPSAESFHFCLLYKAQIVASAQQQNPLSYHHSKQIDVQNG